MKALVRHAMKEARSASPQPSSTRPRRTRRTEELIALAAEGGKFGGIYSTHMRNEGDSVLDALDEALRIGREAHIPVEIWHLKVAGKNELGTHARGHRQDRRMRARTGLDVTADTYAYTAWFNAFSPSFRPGRTTAAPRNSSSA